MGGFYTAKNKYRIWFLRTENNQRYIAIGYDEDLNRRIFCSCFLNLEKNHFYYSSGLVMLCSASSLIEHRLASNEETDWLFSTINALGLMWHDDEECIVECRQRRFNLTLDPLDDPFDNPFGFVRRWEDNGPKAIKLL